MFYVYILESERDGMHYTGFTHNLRRRVMQHNAGMTTSTRNRGRMKLIFYEAYINKYDALRREKYLKSSKGKSTIHSMLKEYLAVRS